MSLRPVLKRHLIWGHCHSAQLRLRATSAPCQPCHIRVHQVDPSCWPRPGCPQPQGCLPNCTGTMTKVRAAEGCQGGEELASPYPFHRQGSQGLATLGACRSTQFGQNPGPHSPAVPFGAPCGSHVASGCVIVIGNSDQGPRESGELPGAAQQDRHRPGAGASVLTRCCLGPPPAWPHPQASLSTTVCWG